MIDSFRRVAVALLLVGALGWGGSEISSFYCDGGACAAASWLSMGQSFPQSTPAAEFAFAQETAGLTGLYLFFGALIVLGVIEVAKPHLARRAAKRTSR